MRPIAALLLAAVLGACASTGADTPPVPEVTPRTAWIVGQDGRAIGQATFTEGDAGVLIRLEFSDRALSPGWHGLHLHTRGDCSDFANGFRASGGHLGMRDGVRHGLMIRRGPEAGDLPNIFATPAGPFGAEMFTPHVTLIGDQPLRGRLPLLDADGTALMIHAGPDDHATQPIGGAGDRVACAALTLLP
ncbi:MAG: superoxide dismutase family protein [Caulobacterales bacterium]|nr:superoxide dismutase family protein [Caulobacterales bacterium]